MISGECSGYKVFHLHHLHHIYSDRKAVKLQRVSKCPQWIIYNDPLSILPIVNTENIKIPAHHFILVCYEATGNFLQVRMSRKMKMDMHQSPMLFLQHQEQKSVFNHQSQYAVPACNQPSYHTLQKDVNASSALLYGISSAKNPRNYHKVVRAITHH